MFTTKAGELLICKKAFGSSVEMDHISLNPSDINFINPYSDCVIADNQASAMAQHVQKLQWNPLLIQLIAFL